MVARTAKTGDERSGDSFRPFNDCPFSSFPNEHSFDKEKNKI
jgi:hypothetical protein